MQRRLLLLSLAITLGGCSQILGEAKIIRVKADLALDKRDEAVITSRLSEHNSGFFPSLGFSTANGETLIRAEGAPSDAELQFLLGHRGVFEVKSEQGRLWFSQKDIVDAVAGFTPDQQPAVTLKLTADGAARLARESAESIGRIVVAELDGERLTSAKVTSRISAGSIQMSLDRPPREAILIATILKSGPLSFTPVHVQVQVVR